MSKQLWPSWPKGEPVDPQFRQSTTTDFGSRASYVAILHVLTVLSDKTFDDFRPLPPSISIAKPLSVPAQPYTTAPQSFNAASPIMSSYIQLPASPSRIGGAYKPEQAPATYAAPSLPQQQYQQPQQQQPLTRPSALSATDTYAAPGIRFAAAAALPARQQAPSVYVAPSVALQDDVLAVARARAAEIIQRAAATTAAQQQQRQLQLQQMQQQQSLQQQQLMHQQSNKIECSNSGSSSNSILHPGASGHHNCTAIIPTAAVAVAAYARSHRGPNDAGGCIRAPHRHCHGPRSCWARPRAMALRMTALARDCSGALCCM